MELENTLEKEQSFVGGLIDVYAVTDNLDLVFNDEGLINGLEPRVVVFGESAGVETRELRAVIYGDCFICRHDDEGDFLSIGEEDVETIKKFVKVIIAVYADAIIIEE